MRVVVAVQGVNVVVVWRLEDKISLTDKDSEEASKQRCMIPRCPWSYRFIALCRDVNDSITIQPVISADDLDRSL